MATPFMNLSLPTPTVTIGPGWATDLNTALERVDEHDHSSGFGQKITPAGLNISDDLDINDNNLDNVNSMRMKSQSGSLGGASDIRSVYSVSGDLYYNNGSGTAIQITSGSGLNAASLGGIGGDYATSTASLFYTSASSLFTFDRSSGVRADVDLGEVTIREGVVSANGITLKSPTSLGASYNLTLPSAVPASTKILTMTSGGVVSPLYDVDNSTTEISSNNIIVKDAGITDAKIAATAVSYAKLSATARGDIFSKVMTNSVTAIPVTTWTAITNFSLSVTTANTVSVTLSVSGASSSAVFSGSNTILRVLRAGLPIAYFNTADHVSGFTIVDEIGSSSAYTLEGYSITGGNFTMTDIQAVATITPGQ